MRYICQIFNMLYKIVTIVILYCTISCFNSGDTVIKEYTVDKNIYIRLKAFSEWELSIPIYLEIIKNNRIYLKSGPFYYVSPENLKDGNLNFEIIRFHNIIYIYTKKRSELILSIIDIKNKIVYPPDNIKNKDYHREIKKRLLSIRKYCSNENLNLYK